MAARLPSIFMTCPPGSDTWEGARQPGSCPESTGFSTRTWLVLHRPETLRLAGRGSPPRPGLQRQQPTEISPLGETNVHLKLKHK